MKSVVLARRRHVMDFEAGERALPEVDGPLRYARPALLPVSSAVGVATAERVLALTYDDGPDPESTPAVLDALAAHGVRATFFLLTDLAEQHSHVVRRILAEGHEVGLHGQDHARLSTLPSAVAVGRIRAARRRLEAVTGRPVRLYRPAYGAQRVLQAAGTRALGMELVLWTAWARDWEGGSAEEVADRAAAAVHPGTFLLLHDTAGDLEVPGPPLDRAAVTKQLLGHLTGHHWATATVGELLDRHPVLRALWFERAAAAWVAASRDGRPV